METILKNNLRLSGLGALTGDYKRTPLQMLIDMACDPSVPEPDLALCMEVCDNINTTKKNSPHEAATAILEYVNGSEQHQAMLALNLLDVCAKNCGYPFHLQIASKDFLNDLVKKFPERPPPAKTMVQEKVLELIQQWNVTIVENSKHKVDLGHINDMFRLLQYKGYKFPRVREDAAKVMNASSSMKTKDEMEEEDRAAQAAKLQELLRRGTPSDLKEANDLMKLMTGFYHDKKPDYEKKANDELEIVVDKAHLLMDILRQLSPGAQVSNNQTIQDLLSAIKTAKPKISKSIEEELTDPDSEKLPRFLSLNDLLNDVTNLYDEIKQKGVGNVAIPPSAPRSAVLGTATPAKATTASTLIDFGDIISSSNPVQQPPVAPAPKAASGPSAPTSSSSLASAAAPKAAAPVADLLGDLEGLSFNQPAPVMPIMGGHPGMIRLESINKDFWTPKPMAGASALGGLQQQPLFGSALNPPPVTGSSNSASPTNRPANVPTSMMMMQAAPTSLSPPSIGSSPGIVVLSTAGAPAGEQSVDKTIFDKNGLKIQLRGKLINDVVSAECYFSNAGAAAITALVFQLAVPTVMKLQLDAASGSVLPPGSVNSVMQTFQVLNPGKVPLKLRFRLTFTVNGLNMTEQGEIANLF